MQEKDSESEIKNTGRWTKEEHQRFMYAIMQYGKDWKKVEQYVRTRTGSQVRSHAQKFFNKLQKGPHGTQQHNKNQQPEFSETEFDIQRQLNNQATPCTPIELVSLIKKQSKEEGGRINLGNLKKTLEEHHNNEEKEENGMPECLQRANSYKSMSNILSAYEQINDDKQEMKNQDESFLILLTKKYKRFFNKIDDFDKLIDFHEPVKQVIHKIETAGRKRSFTLPQGNELEGDQLEEKIEQIKKKIKTEVNEANIKQKEKKQCDPIIILKSQPKQIQLIALKEKLSTIHEQPKEEDQVPSNKDIKSSDGDKKQSTSPLNHTLKDKLN